MAFTPEQKKNIDLLIQSPDKFLAKIKDISIESYKEQSFQDGKGLSHILAEKYIENPQAYQAIAVDLLNNGFRLDDSFRDETPITSVFKKYSDLSYARELGPNHDALLSLISIGPDQLTIEDSSRVLHCLYKEENLEPFKEAFKLVKKITNNEYWKNTLESIILSDNKALIEFMVNNGINIKEELTTISYRKMGRNTDRLQEKSNLLVCALDRSENISHYFLDNFNFKLDGKITYPVPEKEDYKWKTSENNVYRTNFPSHTRNDKKTIYSAIHPLDEAFRLNKFDLFKKILINLKNEGLSNLLYSEKITPLVKRYPNLHFSNEMTRETATSLISKISQDTNSQFYLFVRDNIESIVKNAPDQEKLNFISHTLENKLISYNDKLFFSQGIIPNMKKVTEVMEVTDYYYRTQENKTSNILDAFLNVFYNSNVSSKDIDTTGKILALALSNPNPPFTNYKFYKKELYQHPQILNTFIAYGLDINHDYENNKTVNPFYFYATHKENYSNQFDASIVNKNFNTLKSLAQDLSLPVLDSWNEKKSLITYATSKLDSLLLHNLTDKEILTLSKDTNPISTLAVPNDNQLQTYEYITERLFGLGYKFFTQEHKQDFYTLLKHHRNHDFILKVLDSEDMNFKELSSNIKFWEHVLTQEKNDFVKSNGANFNSTDMTLQISALENKESFKHYINNEGNINYINDEKDNLLHYLIKNEHYENANHVLLKYPQLSEEVNKQKKIPLQYMIVSFNRECGIHSYSKRKDFTQQKQLFENYITHGSFNNKAKKLLMEQIEKYTSIRTQIPNIKEILLYKVLDSSPIKNPSKPIKRNKI